MYHAPFLSKMGSKFFLRPQTMQCMNHLELCVYCAQISIHNYKMSVEEQMSHEGEVVYNTVPMCA